MTILATLQHPRPQRMVTDQRGATAAEFALVLPLIILILFAIIDVGIYGFKINRDEKATQMGARMAVVIDPVDSGMAGYSFIENGYMQGDPIPASALGQVTCTASGCTCDSTCPWTPTLNTGPFNLIVGRMQKVDPAIKASNVAIEYRGSGLGYAGDPSGMEIAPLTTVKLQQMKYRPLTLLFFNADIPLPSFKYTLTSEDSSGSKSF